MNIFYRRPLCFLLFSFIIFSALAVTMSALGKVILATAAIILSLIFLIFALVADKRIFPERRQGFTQCSLCCIAVFSALLISFIYFNATLEKYTVLDGKNYTVIGEIIKVRSEQDFASYYDINITDIDGKKENIKMSLDAERNLSYKPGDVVRAEVTFEIPSENSNGFSLRSYLLSSGIVMSAAVSGKTEIIGRNNLSPYMYFSQINSAVSSYITSSFEGEAGNMLSAVLLGNRELISLENASNFRRLGITHVLAISGMHLSILLGCAELLLRIIGVNKKIRFALLIPFTVLYMGVTGFSMSVCRSGIMLIFVYAAFLLGQERDSLTTLFFAVSVILIFRPFAVLSSGLWLSFFATFVIIIFNTLAAPITGKAYKLNMFGKLIFAVLTRLALTLLIIILTMPIIWIFFGEISLMSPLSNLIITTMVELLMFALPLVLVFAFVPFVQTVVCFYMNLIFGIADAMAAQKGILFSLEYPFSKYFMFAVLILFALFLTMNIKRKRRILIPALLLLAAFSSCILIYNAVYADKLLYTYSVSGKNEQLILKDNLVSTIIDLSDGTYSSAARAVDVSSGNALPEIDAYIITHYHNRNVNTIKRLIASTYVDRLYLPPAIDEKSASVQSAIIETAKQSRTDFTIYDYDAEFEIENCGITIMTPHFLKRSTHPALALCIDYAGDRITWLGGSVLDDGSDSFVDEYMPDTTALIFGVHGPVCKKTARLSSAPIKLDCLLFANSEVFSYFDGNSAHLKSAANAVSAAVVDSKYEILLNSAP